MSLSLLYSFSHTPDIHTPGAPKTVCPSNLTYSVPWACERGTPLPHLLLDVRCPHSPGPKIILFSVLILLPRPQHHITNVTCLVTFPVVGVTVERDI